MISFPFSDLVLEWIWVCSGKDSRSLWIITPKRASQSKAGWIFLGFEQTLTKYDLISIDEYGYSDLLDYMGSGSETISWWTFRFISKKTGELIKVFCHFSHSFNAEGQITRQVAYYNGALLP